ncbi:MAG TPA: M28 family peptidase [Chitinophagaceae bacterium]
MMNIFRIISAIFLFFIFTDASGQKLKKADKEIIANLQKHIDFLSNDKLEGRRTGTAGEKLAAEYISQRFQEIGLTPKGSNNFLQPFEVYDGKQIGANTSLEIEDVKLQPGKDFFPFPYSPNINLEALPAIAVRESDMPWFLNLKETLEGNSNNPHFNLEEFIIAQMNEMSSKGATALFIYNTSQIDDQLFFDPKDKSQTVKIPVVYISKPIAEKFFSDESATIDLKLVTSITEMKRTGNNVIGYIDNGAANVVVLGAHYDHLGYGEDGNSMLRTGEKLIHNGADDNASGIGGLIELARMLKTGKEKSSNYLFIAFSGEELGLFGSKYFTEHPTVDLAAVNYMINMDMIGRLNDSTNTVTVGGYGTSPSWSFIGKEKKLPFSIKIDSSGSGPSDHTSFYRKSIPVLFFFTGLHSDYHRPTDDANKINTIGEYRIISYIEDVISELNRQNQKLAFLKTRETQMSGTAKFSVTLGIMPDYTFSGAGVRADGISEGRPAQKAGLQAGDIILQLGDHPISSMEKYMEALGKFKKGDNTKLKYKRGEEILETVVQF